MMHAVELIATTSRTCAPRLCGLAALLAAAACQHQCSHLGRYATEIRHTSQLQQEMSINEQGSYESSALKYVCTSIITPWICGITSLHLIVEACTCWEGRRYGVYAGMAMVGL